MIFEQKGVMYFDPNSIIENNNLDNMSTTLVSAFYDFDVLSNKNQKNNQVRTQYCTERRATIGNLSISSVAKNRNLSTGSFIPIGSHSSPGVSVPLADNCMLSNREATIREHRKLDRSMSEPVGALNNVNNSAQRNQNVNSSRYKTELCRPYEESGHCKYGDKCQFAHGAQELRTLSRHPKYKTELCRTFHTIGFCPYGPRCHFIHNEDERTCNTGTCKGSMSSAAQQALVNKNANMMTNPHVTSQPVMNGHSSSMDQLSQVKRPSSINFNSSYNGSLGSSSESLSSSASDSPSLSPTSWANDDIFRDIPQYSSSGSNSSTSSSPVFNYSADLNTAALANLLSPLNVQTGQNNPTQTAIPTASDITILQQQLNAILNLNQCNKNQAVFDSTWDLNPAPHSPPESISGESVGSTSSCTSGSSSANNGLCGSALDVSKSLRLPIFNQLSHDD